MPAGATQGISGFDAHVVVSGLWPTDCAVGIHGDGLPQEEEEERSLRAKGRASAPELG